MKRISPSREQLIILLEHYQNGRFDHAEKLSVSITKEFPKHQFGWKVLGAVLKQTGRVVDSLTAMQKSVQLAPQDAEAHSNLGNTLKELGRLEEAEVSCRQAIALKPDFAEAHSNLGVTIKELGRLDEAEASYTQAIALRPNFAEARNNLGITLQELGRLDEAEVSLRQAIALKPDFAEAHSNLGNTLKELGRLDEAFSVYIQAINLNPDFTDAYVNLAIVINNVRFNSSNVKLYPPLIRLLSTGNFARPADLAPSILSLVKHDPMIKDLLLEKNFATSLAGATSMIGSIDKLTLLHYLMRVCPLPDLQFEGFFVAMRSLLLKNIDNIEASPELIYFLSTLSLHCFTNEYVYLEKDEETELVENLEIQITHAIAKSEQPEAIKILCLASYRPLHQYDWCQQLEALDHLEEVKSRLIKEPHAEKVIEADISVLGEMSDEVSLKVREQYEENPYPRWVKLAISTKAKSIAEVCTDINLHLHSESIKNVTAPAILIAGCGTGQHSIETASRFSGCYVTAVDLSLASLAYAQRKTTELGLDNLEYLQADILRLNHLEQEFDIIESMGVLHHMDKPMVGWRVLVDLLKPDGLMKIGLYSELARSQIVKARREIASLGIGTSATEIRNYRESLRVSESKDKKRLKIFGDFFSLSEFRDLIFHVQEHRFTLLQIKSCLNELGLNFCGFADKDTDYRFREFHGEGSDICDLVLWHEFEESHPDTFKGMYQFWCQKL
ncbi:tetratricopeptide repeat protein [Hyphomicrobiales bacterium]|nr:tetratricopeptide repeat protein [Hyphomicrobiales bacterium]